MEWRTVLVTGRQAGSAGTAAALGEAGAAVLIHAPDQARPLRPPKSCRAIGGGSRPCLGPVDPRQVAGSRPNRCCGRARRFACAGDNAGARFQRAVSPDGVERTLAVNHLAVAALTSMLLDALRGRGLYGGTTLTRGHLSSTMEKRGNPNLQDWANPDRFSQLQAYGDSKLVNSCLHLRPAGNSPVPG